MTEFLGVPKVLNPSELPTNRAVLLQAILLRQPKMVIDNIDNRNYSNQQLAKDVGLLVSSQWSKANAKLKPPVIIKEYAIVKRIVTLLEKVKNVVHGRVKKQQKVLFILNLVKLMDLTTCPHNIYLCRDEKSGCSDSKSCLVQAHIICSCPR